MCSAVCASLISSTVASCSSALSASTVSPLAVVRLSGSICSQPQIPRVAQNCQDALPMVMRQASDESGSARRVRSYSSSARIFATISRFTFSQSAFTGPPR